MKINELLKKKKKGKVSSQWVDPTKTIEKSKQVRNLCDKYDLNQLISVTLLPETCFSL